MGTDTDKFNQCVGALHSKTSVYHSDLNYRLINLDFMNEKERQDYTRDGRISNLSEKSRKEITSFDLKNVTSDEYAQSRVWRANDFADLVFRAVLKPYFHLEYNFIKITRL